MVDTSLFGNNLGADMERHFGEPGLDLSIFDGNPNSAIEVTGYEVEKLDELAQLPLSDEVVAYEAAKAQSWLERTLSQMNDNDFASPKSRIRVLTLALGGTEEEAEQAVEEFSEEDLRPQMGGGGGGRAAAEDDDRKEREDKREQEARKAKECSAKSSCGKAGCGNCNSERSK